MSTDGDQENLLQEKPGRGQGQSPDQDKGQDSSSYHVDYVIQEPGMVKAKLRLAVAVVLAVAITVVLFKLSSHKTTFKYTEYGSTGQGVQLRKLNQPFAWHDGDDDGEALNNGTITTCRNSVQGKVLLADDMGYVCQRHDLQSSGCCNVNATATHRYSCHECHEASGCCKLYEHCISCCMNPKKKPLLQHVLKEASQLKNILLLSVSDHFELCLAKCRTSSSSVRHENVYIDAANKHCYTKAKKGSAASATGK